MTLYEVDARGWVHRQVQLHADGSRFSPEDILMCHPVVTDAMANHPAADEISAAEFEEMWREVTTERPFRARIPDPTVPWVGHISFGGELFEIAWAPDAPPEYGWAKIPGFEHLFVHGDPKRARAACGAVFVNASIEWYAVRKAA